MPHILSNMTKPAIILIAASTLILPAVAQEGLPEMQEAPKMEAPQDAQMDTPDNGYTHEDYFAAADIDISGALTASEYRVYINTRADDRDSQAIQIRSLDSYDAAFDSLDVDGNGLLSLTEIKAA